MIVRCLKSFAGRDAAGNRVSYGMGDVFELPEGVDWLRVGLVEIVIEEERGRAGTPAPTAAETATAEPAGETTARAKTVRRKRSL